MPARNTEELIRQAQLKPPATDFLAQSQDARHYSGLLIENHLWMDAIAYMSHAITPRESIWWAWFCARKALAAKAKPEEIKALALSEAWIAQPNDENRLLARNEVNRIPPSSPANAVLQAISFTGEFENEMTGEKSPSIPYLSNKFVSVAVINSVYALDAENPETVAVEFLNQSHDVAQRINLWASYS